MPAREIVFETGEYKRVYISPVRRVSSGRRGKKFGMTSAVQARYNQKRAEARAADILHLNFTPADLALHLTFRPDSLPDSFDEAKHELDKMLRRIKYRWSKEVGRPGSEFRYFAVPEPHKNGNIHFHLVLSGGLDRDVIESLWPHGYANVRRLRFDTSGLEGLAHYILKTPGYSKKRWYCSQNLARPAPRQSDNRVRVRDARDLADAALGGSVPFDLIGELYPGYSLIPDSLEAVWSFGDDEENAARRGCPFVTFRLYRTDSPWFRWRRRGGGSPVGTSEP